jgi:Methyltransferase domain
MPLSIYGIYDLVGPLFRKRRLLTFLKMLKPTEQTTILDVGGYYHFWRDLPLRPPITLVNIDDPPPADELPPNFTFVLGDGRCLPFPSQSFDIVFSNSVIEHVGSYEDQQRFAREVRRVGRTLCVQTPNRAFPIEPHFIGPSSPYLPRELQRSIFRWCSVRGWLRRWDHADFDALFNEVRLLSYPEMRALFPDSEIIRERFCGLTKSFTAVRGPQRVSS